MIFVDSNIPMYLVGAEHPNKHAAQRLLDQAISRRERLVTDAEVLQEVLHRYTAIRRVEAVEPALSLLLEVVDSVVPVEVATVLRAKDVVLAARRLSARDAIHIAAMEAVGTARIMTFDAGFDEWPGLERLS